MSEHVRIRSFNTVRARLFGYKPTSKQRAMEWLIEKRSMHTHTEIQFSERYGSISFSSTMRDGVNGCRFKMIPYKHPERYDTVYVLVTAEQEARMFVKACEMSDIDLRICGQDCFVESLTSGRMFVSYGSCHVKYDRGGAAFSYWTKWDIYKPSKKKRVCCRAVAEVVLAGYPKCMNIKIPITAFTGKKAAITRKADYASMTPSEIDGMMRNFFSAENIIKRVEI